jgi:hypothetical protein
MTVRRKMAEWRETRVTCEPCPYLSRFSRPSRLSWTPYHIPTPIQTYG